MRVLIGALSLALTAAATWWLAQGLAPVRQVTFAAGGQGGGYWAVAEQYEAILARDGIVMTILETAGSGENAQLLANGTAQVALLQGGISAPPKAEALSAIFHEPLFLFARKEADVSPNPGTWSGLSIALGAEGSGTRVAAIQFLSAAGTVADNRLLPLSGSRAADALIAGEADVGVFVAPLGAPYLAPLFASAEVGLLPLDHRAAIAGRLAQSSPITLPAGAVTLAPLTPSDDIAMLAMTARLVATADLHPSLVDRFVEAARQIHSGRDALTREGDFPTLQGAGMPADVYAADLLRNGTSPLSQYLPYWIVAQINRFAILLVPVFLLLLPLLRALPGLYQWRMRNLVFRHYQAIRDIDTALQNADGDARAALLTRLDQIDRDLADLRLPLHYRNHAYTARMHVDLLRRRLAERA